MYFMGSSHQRTSFCVIRFGESVCVGVGGGGGRAGGVSSINGVTGLLKIG